MSEVSAPVAPAAPAAPSADAGGAGGVGGAAPTTAAPSNGAPARGPDGKFVSGSAPPANGEAPKTAEQKAEEAYFKRKLKLFGKEKEVAYKDQEELARDLQRGFAAIERQKPLMDEAERARRIIQLAKDKGTLQDFLREAGHDPVEFARELLSGQARKAAMTPEEAELEELRAFKSNQERAEQERAEKEKQTEAEKFNETQKAQTKALVFEALKHTNLPQTYETIFEMAHTLRVARSQEGVDYGPEELAKETERRLAGYTERYIGGLDGPALVKRLGPEVTKRIVEAYITSWEANQASTVAAPAPVVDEAPAQPGPRKYLSEAEVNANLRAIANAR